MPAIHYPIQFHGTSSTALLKYYVLHMAAVGCVDVWQLMYDDIA